MERPQYRDRLLTGPTDNIELSPKKGEDSVDYVSSQPHVMDDMNTEEKKIELESELNLKETDEEKSKQSYI